MSVPRECDLCCGGYLYDETAVDASWWHCPACVGWLNIWEAGS